MKVKGNCWKFKFWRIPHLDNLELFHGLNVTYEYPRHMHEEYSIGLILQGMDTTTCRGASYSAYPGNLLLFNAGEVHSSSSVETEYRIINISPKTLNRIGFQIMGRNFEIPCFPGSAISDARLFRALLNLHLKLGQKLSPLEHESEFIRAIAFLLERQNKNYSAFQTTGKEPHYIELAQDFLKSHYAENVSLAGLSSVTNLSPYYLLRVFHKQVGCPPHEYQTQLRIAHAKKLIRDGNSILETALETGFFDQSHFSRNFKRIVGITPG
jgi:AraC-like DNA-binding protein